MDMIHINYDIVLGYGQYTVNWDIMLGYRQD